MCFKAAGFLLPHSEPSCASPGGFASSRAAGINGMGINDMVINDMGINYTGINVTVINGMGINCTGINATGGSAPLPYKCIKHVSARCLCGLH